MGETESFDVVRRADSYELLTSVTLALSDEFPAFDFDVFTARVVAAAQHYTAFQLGLVPRTCPATGAREHLWVRVPASYWATAPRTGFVAREAWQPDAPVDTNAATAGLVALDGTPLVRVRVSTAPGGARCRVRVVASHCVADGRTLASLFDVVRACVPGEPPCALRDCPLCPYGQRANFGAALPEAALHTVPASWTAVAGGGEAGGDVVRARVLPPLSAAQAAAAAYVADRWCTPWAPLAQCLAARHGGGVAAGSADGRCGARTETLRSHSDRVHPDGLDHGRHALLAKRHRGVPHTRVLQQPRQPVRPCPRARRHRRGHRAVHGPGPCGGGRHGRSGPCVPERPCTRLRRGQ